MDQGNDGVFAEIGRLVQIAFKRERVDSLFLEFTCGRVEDYNVSNLFVVCIHAPCDDNFSRVEWYKCRTVPWDWVIFWHFNILPEQLL